MRMLLMKLLKLWNHVDCNIKKISVLLVFYLIYLSVEPLKSDKDTFIII